MTAPDFIYGVTPGDIVYDIETFPNVFTLYAIHADTGREWKFELSTRRNDLSTMCHFIEVAKRQGCRMVGFNNFGFDYPVIHYIITHLHLGVTVNDIYNIAMSIINSPFNARFAHVIWDKDQVIQQLDLFKIHHFDNPSKSTGLKVLEFNMQMESVEDLPFPVGTALSLEQVDILLSYNRHDVKATLDFYRMSASAITLRERLSTKFNRNMLNMSDVKIGETLLIMEMEQQGVECYHYVKGRREKKQTIRESLDLADVMLPYLSFQNPEFKRVHNWLREQTITETKGVFTDLTATVGGLEYKIGTGGLHASVHNEIVESSNTHQLVDVDVASFYPNLSIKNGLYPAHLGIQFCYAYAAVYQERKKYPKKTPENEAYKLALNGAYGGSNNRYSPFYDMGYTMSITINGQLSLLMLVEQMLLIPGLSMVQCNTDGITYLCPREYLDHSRRVCRWWEELTNLELEEALYSRMFVRDVNSYIAEGAEGKLKRIGAYAHVTAIEDPGTRELPWHKDWSSRVVAKAAEAALVHGTDIRTFIKGHVSVYDFMLRTKVPRSSMLEWGKERVPNIIRYYISTGGDILEKVMPPAGPDGQFKKANGVSQGEYDFFTQTHGPFVWDGSVHTKNHSVYEERRSGVHTGRTIKICNSMKHLNTGPDALGIDYEYYINEAEKLMLPLRG